MLTDRIRLSGSEGTDPEDFLSTSLGVIFPDDITNQHGDLDHSVIYESPRFGDIILTLAKPTGADVRLFSHFVWNSALLLSEYIEDGVSENPRGHLNLDVKGGDMLELGAGTGLTGILAAKVTIHRVMITDYPAPEVLSNIRHNVERNIKSSNPGKVTVLGHSWGELDLSDPFVATEKNAFSRVLVAECLWMPWQHRNLMKSIAWFMAPEGRAWVVAGFHTGRAKMAGFYDDTLLAEEGLKVERIWERNAEGTERDWVVERGNEEIAELKRWLVVGILRKIQ